MFNWVLNTPLETISKIYKEKTLHKRGKFILKYFFNKSERISLRKKSPYSEFFWSVFSSFGLNITKYLSAYSQNAGKHGPGKLRIRILFHAVYKSAGFLAITNTQLERYLSFRENSGNFVVLVCCVGTSQSFRREKYA